MGGTRYGITGSDSGPIDPAEVDGQIQRRVLRCGRDELEKVRHARTFLVTVARCIYYDNINNV